MQCTYIPFLLKNLDPYKYLFANKMILFADTRFLFEGHLTVGQEPPPPAWLVADNLARELSILTESSGGQDGNSNRIESRAEDVTPAIMNFLESISGNRDLETALEESLQVGINIDHENPVLWYMLSHVVLTVYYGVACIPAATQLSTVMIKVCFS